MTVSDAPAVCKILNRSILEVISEDPNYKPDVVQTWATSTPQMQIKAMEREDRFVGVVDGLVAAVGSVRKKYSKTETVKGYIYSPKTREIVMLYVDPDFKNRVYGRQMMDCLVKFLIESDVDYINLIATRYAIKFYQSYGFEIIYDIDYPIRQGTALLPVTLMLKKVR